MFDWEAQAIMALSNAEDLVRLRKLEAEGHFPAGYALESTKSVVHYLARVAWLVAIRKMPGAQPYPGPDIFESRGGAPFVQTAGRGMVTPLVTPLVWWALGRSWSPRYET